MKIYVFGATKEECKANLAKELKRYGHPVYMADSVEPEFNGWNSTRADSQWKAVVSTSNLD